MVSTVTIILSHWLNDLHFSLYVSMFLTWTNITQPQGSCGVVARLLLLMLMTMPRTMMRMKIMLALMMVLSGADGDNIKDDCAHMTRLW